MEEPKQKPPRRWLWFVALYATSIIAIGSVSYLLRYLVMKLS